MKTKFLFLFSVIALLALTNTSFAQDGKWAKNHPRRTEVNSRLANQNSRIHNKVQDGQMSKAKAAKLHKEDHQIRHEERDMASQNHGHITKQEQRTLNQQENHVSRQISR
jgi:CRISPR/Cas system-associated endoribonuclease Cas2